LFFQAEDGIRDHCVTGVQTCALPICLPPTMMVQKLDHITSVKIIVIANPRTQWGVLPLS